jgi:penicillin amidase
MRTQIKFSFFLVLTIATLILLNSRLGQIPPPGKFLDPIKGIWQNALIPDIPNSGEVLAEYISDDVKIVFNERGVPHIFAQNDRDLYFAVGYVTAMHRLWQMEFTAHAGLGRISEIVGERAMEFDRYLRRVGMTYGAEKLYELIENDPEMLNILEAYTEGVNTWISKLKPGHYPFEYKLLDYEPQPWTLMKTIAMVMNISRTLSLRTQANNLTHMKALWGKDAVMAFFPGYYDGAEPIISSNTKWDFDLQPPLPPDDKFIPQFVFENLLEAIPEGIGSNNWAVSPARSKTGNALLAIDPHQPLNLPSMWYEMQLNAPGINVYGVTLPGAPSVVVGFNNYIAWGNTASTNFVVDMFEIELDEENLRYFYENQWYPLELRIEEIKIRDKGTITDTVRYTHHGPVLHVDYDNFSFGNFPAGHAMSWTALKPKNTPLRALKIMNSARDYSQFREGLSNIGSPPQNYAFASVDGDIALQTNGLWPLRWKNQGVFISDGRKAEYDWKGFIPFEKLPYELNPQRGFVSSANQVHTDTLYPFYYGWDFATHARATIINNELRQLNNATIEDMKALQLNASNHEAYRWLDSMIDSVSDYLEKIPGFEKEPEFTEILDTLRQWNRQNEASLIAPTVFIQWRDEVRKELWKPILEPLKDSPHLTPNIDISFQVLNHNGPADVFASLTGHYPLTGEILATSLNRVISKLIQENGPPGENWQWWRFNGPYLSHTLNIPSLGTGRMKVNGSSLSPNAVRNAYGPSWRMVAEMSEPVKVWGIYPGGQSANPATKGYNAFTNDWAEGSYYQLRLYDTFEEAAFENETIIRIKSK